MDIFISLSFDLETIDILNKTKSGSDFDSSFILSSSITATKALA
jgi:hypothetical protein